MSEAFDQREALYEAQELDALDDDSLAERIAAMPQSQVARHLIAAGIDPNELHQRMRTELVRIRDEQRIAAQEPYTPVIAVMGARGMCATREGDSLNVFMQGIPIPSPLATLLYWGTWYASRLRDPQNLWRAWMDYRETEPFPLKNGFRFLPREAKSAILAESAKRCADEEMDEDLIL